MARVLLFLYLMAGALSAALTLSLFIDGADRFTLSGWSIVTLLLVSRAASWGECS